MPWVLLLRWLFRIATALFVWRLMAARRRAYVTGSPGPRPFPRMPLDPQAAAAAIREGVSLAWRIGTVVSLLAALVVLITAGTSVTVLGPRWLGGALLGVALVVVIATAVEARAVLRAFAARRRRRHDDDLRHLV